METAAIYFTRRAGQERGNAAGAASAEARKAHLELALRLVRVATDPALLGASSGWLSSVPRQPPAVGVDEVGDSLAAAFPLPPNHMFDGLLEAVDQSDRAKR
jgi:hypothetical protein